MIETFARRLLQYRGRKRAVIIITILTALVVVWPAADEYTAARRRTAETIALLRETEHRISTLPLQRAEAEQKRRELQAWEQMAVSQRTAQELQNALTELGRETGCTVRRSRLADVTARDWKEGDHPLQETRLDARGETPFRLESRHLALSVTGPMDGLYKFLEGLHQVDKMIHGKAVSIKRAEEGGDQSALDVELLMFDLTRKSAES